MKDKIIAIVIGLSAGMILIGATMIHTGLGLIVTGAYAIFAASLYIS